MNQTEKLLQAVSSKENTPNEIASLYALALCDPDSVEWPKVNNAIIERWSRTRLVQIKEAAWKRLEHSRKAHA